MNQIAPEEAKPPRRSTLVLYYLASGVWMVAGIATMVMQERGGVTWIPYLCVTMGMLFFTLARRKRRREDGEIP